MDKKLKILSITGCSAGIAHTFMAAEGIETAAKKLGYSIKVETHGIAGPENVFTKKEIVEADLILIAADINVTRERFYGKKFYSTNTDLAIINPEKLIHEAFEKASILKDPLANNGDGTTTVAKSDILDVDTKSSAIKHIMFALSWMIPVIVGAAMALCLGMLIGLDKGWIQGADGWTWGKVLNLEGHPVADNMYTVGAMGLGLIFPVMAAGIAYSIGGKLGFAPAFIGGYIMNNGEFLNIYLINEDGSTSAIGTGFFGAIAIGFFVGYMINLYKKIKINKKAKPIIDFLLVPFIATIIVILVSRYIFGPILGPIVVGMFMGLQALEDLETPIGIYLIAVIIAMMMCFDLGGPVNKTAYIFATWVWVASVEASPNPVDWDFVPYTAMHVSQVIPPIGAFFATIFFGKKFTKQERSVGYSSAVLGCVGITEGAIPFAAARPKAFIPANLIGGAAVGILCTVLQYDWYAGLASPFDAFLGYVPSDRFDSYFFGATIYGLSLLSCSLLTAFIAVGIMTSSEKNVRYAIYKNEQKEELKANIAEIKSQSTITLNGLKIEINKVKDDEEKKSDFLEKMEKTRINQKETIKTLKSNYKNDLKIHKKEFLEIFKVAKVTKKENVANWKDKDKVNVLALKEQIDALILEDTFINNEEKLEDNLMKLSKSLKANLKEIIKDKEIKINHKYSTMKMEISNYKIAKSQLLSKNEYYILRKKLVTDKENMKNNIKNEHQIMVRG